MSCIYDFQPAKLQKKSYTNQQMQEKVEKKCIFHAKHRFLYTICYVSTCIFKDFSYLCGRYEH